MLSLKAFSDGLRFVSKFAATDGYCYYLKGVALEFAKKGDPEFTDEYDTLFLIATDGCMMARVQFLITPNDLPSLDRNVKYIVDNESVKAITDIKKPLLTTPVDLFPVFHEVKGEDIQFLSLSAGMAQLRLSLIDGVFPDWRRVMPKPSEIDNGSQNQTYINASYLATVFGAFTKLARAAGKPYPRVSVAIHADSTVVNFPSFGSHGELQNPLVKVMNMRR
jgi:DNA polymerase III sliding clamp (beta) subunit (PCNA family)